MIAELRSSAVAWAFPSASTFAGAMEATPFVQYDPIRAPARAQDLILAQRIDGHRVGDVDVAYRQLPFEEDNLHVYGVMSREVLAALLPRCDELGAPVVVAVSALDDEVLAAVRERGQLRPRDARALFGAGTTRGPWGGTSATTTRVLEALHHRGLLRIAYRLSGTKIYEPAVVQPLDLPMDERLRRVTLLLARLLAPVPEQTLGQALTQVRRQSLGVPSRGDVIARVRRSGELDGRVVDGLTYLWPSDLAPATMTDAEPRMRLLAPFDPLVWDRRRFTHLWGWPYRFEAYTPAARRQFGYYALPLLWGEDIVGWANCSVGRDGTVDVAPAFVGHRPRGRAFTQAFDREVARLRQMLAGGST